MATGKYLGKIASVRIGSGGYQDAMFGVTFTLSFDKCCCVGDFWGAWAPSIGIKSGITQWTEEDRQKQVAGSFWKLANLMEKAKVTDAQKLQGVPIEVEMEGNTLKSWRVLEEVL